MAETVDNKKKRLLRWTLTNLKNIRKRWTFFFPQFKPQKSWEAAWCI